MAGDRRRLAANDPRLAEARRRRASGESYEAIGLALGVAASTVHRWINGEAPQRREQVRRAVAATVAQRRAAGMCIECGAPPDPPTKLYCARCAAANRERKRNRHRQMRAAVMAAYGGRCACCGEREDRFLTIDHVNDDGAAHRRMVGNSTAMLVAVIRARFSAGFRVLCFNCNLGRALNGGVCPHAEQRGEVRRLRTVSGGNP